MKQLILAFLCTQVAVMAAAACAEQPGDAVSKPEIDGIVNFSQIDDPSAFAGALTGLGGSTDPSVMAALKERGFATVINLRLESEDDVDVEAGRQAAEQAGLNYIHLPFDAAKPGPGFVDDYLAILKDPANHPTYTHCGSATRAAALWMIGRVLEDGWTLDEASAEAQLLAGKPESAIEFATKYLASR